MRSSFFAASTASLSAAFGDGRPRCSPRKGRTRARASSFHSTSTAIAISSSHHGGGIRSRRRRARRPLTDGCRSPSSRSFHVLGPFGTAGAHAALRASAPSPAPDADRGPARQTAAMARRVEAADRAGDRRNFAWFSHLGRRQPGRRRGRARLETARTPAVRRRSRGRAVSDPRRAPRSMPIGAFLAASCARLGVARNVSSGLSRRLRPRSERSRARFFRVVVPIGTPRSKPSAARGRDRNGPTEKRDGARPVSERSDREKTTSAMSNST